MRPRFPFLVLLFLLALAACNSPTDPLGGAATVSGVVKDPYGNIWGGVTVGMVTDEGVEGSGLTGNDGRYTIRRLQPGRYRVWLQLGRTGPGYFVGEIDVRGGANTFDIVSR